MLRSTLCSMCTRFVLLTLMCLPLMCGGIAPATAAIADVTSFNVHRETVLVTLHKIDFEYMASWDTGLPRRCNRKISWVYNDQLQTPPISDINHTTLPVDVEGTETDVVRSEGSGNYYKIRIEVQNSSDPSIVYAYDGATDAEFDN